MSEDSLNDATWTDSAEVDLADHTGQIRVLARSSAEGCTPDDLFDHTYDVRSAFPGAAGSDSDDSLDKDDPAFAGWATAVASVTYGEAVDETWRTPAKALGPAAGSSGDVLVLGRGGQATLTFAAPLRDGPGFDLAVFENSFSDTFLDLGFVEVSSDGSTFVRFDSAAHTPDSVDAFGSVDPTTIHGLAGAHRQGKGTPFDLSWLRFHPEVLTGQLDLEAVTHVRIVDAVGDGSDTDSFGRPIHDPYPTTGSAGLDLDAVGAIHAASP